MKILIVSHNVFSKTESMGKTLSSYFNGFDAKDLAQFYIHSQVPTVPLCKRYYRITDKEAVKSIIGFPVGTIYNENSIELTRPDPMTDTGITAKIYQKGRDRTPLIYLLRNLWWKLSRWNSRKLNKWIDDFKPDCVFLASGDYSFIYDIALKIAKTRSIPLYVSCVDDFYFHNRNEKFFLGNIQHRHFMRSVKKTMSYATALFCICDKMTRDYAKYFGKPCYTIHTCMSIASPIKCEKKRKISYIGNLDFIRYKQLIAIGRALKALKLDIDHVDVYSPEPRMFILNEMTEENGIVFHGKINADEVLNVMGESLAVIHTESFNEDIRLVVRYSVSTKIADSLSSGTCIFAYGPDDIASMEYLIGANAAVCCTSASDLPDKLTKLINDSDYRSTVVKNALSLAQENHNPECTPNRIKKVLGLM